MDKNYCSAICQADCLVLVPGWAQTADTSHHQKGRTLYIHQPWQASCWLTRSNRGLPAPFCSHIFAGPRGQENKPLVQQYVGELQTIWFTSWNLPFGCLVCEWQVLTFPCFSLPAAAGGTPGQQATVGAGELGWVCSVLWDVLQKCGLSQSPEPSETVGGLRLMKLSFLYFDCFSETGHKEGKGPPVKYTHKSVTQRWLPVRSGVTITSEFFLSLCGLYVCL